MSNVVSYNNPQEQGRGARIRNILIAAVPSVVLALFGIPIFIDLASLLADLISYLVP